MMHLAIGRRLEGVEGLLGGLLPLKDQYRDCFATFTYRRDLLTLDYCHCHQMLNSGHKSQGGQICVGDET